MKKFFLFAASFVLPGLCLMAVNRKAWVSDVNDHIDMILRDLCSEETLGKGFEEICKRPENLRNQWIKSKSDQIPQNFWVLGMGEGSENFRPAFEQACYFSQRRAVANELPKEGELFCSPEHIPVPDGVFDVVFCFEVLGDHMYPEKILQECRRVLKPGGSLYLFNPGSRVYQPKFYMDFSESWYEAAFSRVELNFLDIEYFGRPMQNLAYDVSKVLDHWDELKKGKPIEYQELIKNLFGDMIPRFIYDIKLPQAHEDPSLGYVIKAVKEDKTTGFLFKETE